jgi:hypothetical protein
MSLPLRITFEGQDYTYTILSEIINKDSSEIKILFNDNELTILKGINGKWDVSVRPNDHAELIKAIARAISIRYHL